MHGLAAFIMRGRPQAILLVLATTVVPLIWIGGAVLALVTLRRGWKEGLFVAAVCAAVLALLVQAGLQIPAWPQRPVLDLWLPLLLVAQWLRWSMSLPSALQLAGLVACVALSAMHLGWIDYEAYWRQVFEASDEVFGTGAPEVAERWREAREQFEPYRAGVRGLSLLTAVVVSLLAGRWLQAILYNAGGFRREFQKLNLGRPLALVAAGLLLATAFTGPGLTYDLALVLGSLFVLQTLALAHAAVAARGLGIGWLVGMYVLLPLGFQFYVVIGIADAVFDWRRRLLGPDAPV